MTPRAASGDDLERLLSESHRYVFSLIHKFNKDVNPKQPYSERDDIIVISDEAHRTQAGRLARNTRPDLPILAPAAKGQVSAPHEQRTFLLSGASRAGATDQGRSSRSDAFWRM